MSTIFSIVELSPLEMIIHLTFCLLVSYTSCEEEMKLFADIPSSEDRSDFDSFPLVSRTVREIDWCPGVEEVEEVREVEQELYKKVTVSEHVTAQHVTDRNSGAEG